MPAVPPDPLFVSFDVEYCNSPAAAPGSATITSAIISAGGPPESLYWAFLVSPPASPLVEPGECVTVLHTKEMDSGAGSGSPCAVCGSPSALLDLTFDASGQTILTSDSAGYGCAY